MLIGLNGQKLLDPHPAGPEKYTFNVYSAFSNVDDRNRYEIYFTKEPSEETWGELSNGNPNFNKIIITNKDFWTQVGVARYLVKNPVDIFFTPVHTLPIIRSPKTKYIPMIHGLEHTYTKGFDDMVKRLSIERPVKYACKHANHIVVPSRATKNAIISKGWAEEKDISIVHEGIDSSFHKSNGTEIEDVRKKYGLEDRPYFFFISTIQPRKNVPATIEAFSMFLENNSNFKDMLLVLAGKKGWNYQESLEAPKKIWC